MAGHRRRKLNAVTAAVLFALSASGSLAFLSEGASQSWVRVARSVQPMSSTRRWESAGRADAQSAAVHNTTAAGIHRRRQTRRKPSNRRPKYYWTDLKNVKYELHQFWADCGVVSQPPAIPNDQLLNHFHRHDLRAVIANHYGSRESLADSLGGARIMPGRWTDAVQESPELQQLLRMDDSLSAERPPVSSPLHEAHDNANNNNNHDEHESRRWLHQIGRKPKGYWSLRVVIQELYEYVDAFRHRNGRPAVWMPRPSELGAEGRDDLRQALGRFGGAPKICRTAGMVPYRDWYYFEGQLELLSELRRYLDEFAGSDYRSFPSVSEIHRNGYHELHGLIQYYGGRKFLASRLGMTGAPRVAGDDFCDMNWGPFDLDFAVRLLTFVRQNQMLKNPPLMNPVLGMPSQSKLLLSGDEGSWLADRIRVFGGYENVARRLGLAFFATDRALPG